MGDKGYRCPALRQLLVRSGDEFTLEDQAAVLRHMHACNVCRRDLRAYAALAGALSRLTFSGPPRSPHISDMALAEFAVKGIHAEDAADIIDHLADCQHCREEFVRVRAAMEQLEELGYPCSLPSEPRSCRQRWAEVLRRAFSTRDRVLTVVTGLIALIFAVVCFAGAAHYVLVMSADSIGAMEISDVWWPFAWLSRHDPRGIVLIAILIVASVATGIHAVRGLCYAIRHSE